MILSHIYSTHGCWVDVPPFQYSHRNGELGKATQQQIRVMGGRLPYRADGHPNDCCNFLSCQKANSHYSA